MGKSMQSTKCRASDKILYKKQKVVERELHVENAIKRGMIELGKESGFAVYAAITEELIETYDEYFGDLTTQSTKLDKSPFTGCLQ